MNGKIWQIWMKRPKVDRDMLQSIAKKHGYARSGDILWDLFETHYKDDIKEFRESSFFAKSEPQKN